MIKKINLKENPINKAPKNVSKEKKVKLPAKVSNSKKDILNEVKNLLENMNNKLDILVSNKENNTKKENTNVKKLTNDLNVEETVKPTTVEPIKKLETIDSTTPIEIKTNSTKEIKKLPLPKEKPVKNPISKKEMTTNSEKTTKKISTNRRGATSTVNKNDASKNSNTRSKNTRSDPKNNNTRNNKPKSINTRSNNSGSNSTRSNPANKPVNSTVNLQPIIKEITISRQQSNNAYVDLEKQMLTRFEKIEKSILNIQNKSEHKTEQDNIKFDKIFDKINKSIENTVTVTNKELASKIVEIVSKIKPTSGSTINVEILKNTLKPLLSIITTDLNKIIKDSLEINKQNHNDIKHLMLTWTNKKRYSDLIDLDNNTSEYNPENTK